MFCQALAGSTAAALTTPFDVLTTAVMTESEREDERERESARVSESGREGSVAAMPPGLLVRLMSSSSYDQSLLP